jgi:histidyl-tRNA synthetase
MYKFQDLGGNNLVLRPEGTAGAMRWLLSQKDLMKNIEKENVKLWYWGPMFRYERP